MTSIQFTQQNIVYHVFNINILSLSMNNNVSDVILDLNSPQIIYNSYNITKHEQKSSANFLQPNYNNISPGLGQNSLNNITITEPLLQDQLKIRQKKRTRTKDYTNQSKNLIDNIDDSYTKLTEPTDIFHDRKTNEKGPVLTDNIYVQNNSTSTIEINHPIAVNQLSQLIELPESEIIKFLFLKSISVTINQIIPVDIASSVAKTYGFTVINNNSPTHTLAPKIDSVVTGKTDPRVPVLAVLGDLNHGKTLLTEVLQNKKIHNKNFNTTQIIKAYKTNLYTNNAVQQIIILDTPGHEAFVKMRSMSLQIADLIIVVIDVSRELSLQAIQIIKETIDEQVPIIIALTKIDIVKIDLDTLKQDIINQDIIPEDLKKSIPIIPISALTNKNIDTLLLNVTTTIKKLDLRACADHQASGVIYNACFNKKTGPVLNTIIQNGTMYVGDIIVAGNIYGKVRAIKDTQNNKLQSASFSSVVEILGLPKVPSIGYTFTVVQNDKEAKKIVKQFRKDKNISFSQSQASLKIVPNTLDNFQKNNIIKQVKLIIKANTQGSIDALLLSLSKIPQSKIQINIVSANVGMITETDIRLAIITKSLVIGFSTALTTSAEVMVKNHKVDIYNHDIISNLIDNIENYTNQFSATLSAKNYIGIANVCSVFSLSTGVAAGCIVESGKIFKDSLIEIVRDKSIIHKGMLKSMKHIKNDIFEAKQGDELGISVEDFNDWQTNDKIKVYIL